MTDIEIARNTKLKNINEIAKKIEKRIKEFNKAIKTSHKTAEKASDILRKNWRDMIGKKLSKKWPAKAAAHHLCPFKLGTTKKTTTGCKAILEKCGIDINHPLNTVILPTKKTFQTLVF